MKYKLIFQDNAPAEKSKNNEEDDKKAKKQNRFTFRHPLKTNVNIDRISATMENLSIEGMHVTSNSFPEVISNVPIYIKKGTEVLQEVQGEVVWIDEYNQGKYKIGFKFHKPLDYQEIQNIKNRVEIKSP